MENEGRFQMKRIACLVFALFFMSLGQAFADYYAFTYVDGAFSVSGTLQTAPGTAGSDGYVPVTGGSINTAPFTATLYTGSATALPVGGSTLSPSGAFLYDNNLSPGSTPASTLSYGGLLFTVGSFGATGYEEINIWNNGGTANSYSFYEGAAAGNYPVEYDGGTFTVAQASAVPVPPAAWLLGCGLLGLIGVRKRLKK